MPFRSRSGYRYPQKRNGKGARAFPLRRIVGVELRPLAYDVSIKVPWEVLECGHAMRPRKDIIGETNASARRCARCSIAEASIPPGPQAGRPT